MASGTESHGNSGQAAIDRFAAMMIERMQQMKDTRWKQGWIGGASGYAGLPQMWVAATIQVQIPSSFRCIPQQ